MNTNRNSARVNGLVFALVLVLASLTEVAGAQLIGTYTIDYRYNAGGCINGYPDDPLRGQSVLL